MLSRRWPFLYRGEQQQWTEAWAWPRWRPERRLNRRALLSAHRCTKILCPAVPQNEWDGSGNIARLRLMLRENCAQEDAPRGEEPATKGRSGRQRDGAAAIARGRCRRLDALRAEPGGEREGARLPWPSAGVHRHDAEAAERGTPLILEGAPALAGPSCVALEDDREWWVPTRDAWGPPRCPRGENH
ncbi:hypothetical protein NDU88_003065 [Pleurodeles waltl]|uniref:Uncharacterized protein n=1 Tax=Pleurodeles waltl TaxID=8319 RepID=A0AAV7SDG5_PLEWA|nr:hypothetical protein NDU88_003065 [Pleurodeles waltl]